MKNFGAETYVTANSGHTLILQGHLTGKEIAHAIYAKYPTGLDKDGASVHFSGRAAHVIENDGTESIRNFSFNSDGIETDIWTAD
jgi:hypothetical protein